MVWVNLHRKNDINCSPKNDINELYKVLKSNYNFEKIIKVNGATLMTKKTFYDAAIEKGQVWLPDMKSPEFIVIMQMKFHARTKSEDYVEEANEDLVFIKHFMNYIKLKKAFTDKKELANYSLPWFNKSKNSLEFDLDEFEDYLQKVEGYKFYIFFNKKNLQKKN